MGSAMFISCKRDSNTPSPLDPPPVSESKGFLGLFGADGDKADSKAEATPKAKAPEPEPSMQVPYRKLSVLCFLLAGVALFFKYRQEAGWLLGGAILAPVIGKVAGMLAGLAVYFVIGGICFGLFVAWQIVRRKYDLTDDGNFWPFGKKKKGMPVG